MTSRIIRKIATFICVAFCLSGCFTQGDKSNSLEDIKEAWELSGNPDAELKKIAEKTSKAEVMKIAEKYYKLAFPNIESDLRDEYNNLIAIPPVFDGSKTDFEFTGKNSLNVAASITYTNAKNYYLALASAVFSLNPEGVSTASNLATAISAYYDDLELEGKGGTAKEKEFYSDAVNMYFYSLTCSAKEGYGKEHLTALTCLGNLFLDLKKFNEAYAAFKAALEIDKTYNPSRTGMYNYYMAVKKPDKALEVLLAGAEYMPVFTRAVKKVTEKTEIEELNIGDSTSVDELEQLIDKLVKIPEVTVADFIEGIDPATAQKIRKDMDVLKKEMTFTVPNMDFLIDKHTAFEESSKVPAVAALAELAKDTKLFNPSSIAEQHELTINKNLDILEQFGVNVDLGFDSDNISEIIQDAMKNPEKYENWSPDIKIPSVDGVKDNALKYSEDLQKAIAGSKKGDSSKVNEELAKSNPSLKILTINPYDYLNPRDILVQRLNIISLTNKMSAYKSYLTKLEEKYGLADTMTEYAEKTTPILQEFYMKMGEVEASDESEEKKAAKLHNLHKVYYPKLNEKIKPIWVEATTNASMRYKKLEKQAAKIYSDCMKHIMLVSDTEVRDYLEDELKLMMFNNIQGAIQQVMTAYSFTHYYDLEQCGCDVKAIREFEERVRAEQKAIAKEKEMKNKEAKKLFDNAILDENSDYYKDIIKKYEYEVNLIVFTYKTNPYKTITQCKFEFGVGGFNGSMLENHYRNTTTYDANLELGGDIGDEKSGKISVKGGFGFTATQRSDGNFYPEDIDVRAKLEGSTTIGNFMNTKVGLEASALRGTKAYAELAATGNEKLDKLKEESRTKFVPTDMSKTVWSGEYVIKAADK